MILNEEKHDFLSHYGILRKSGRYPWGSGEEPSQRAQTFFDTVSKLRSEGMNDVDIAKSFSTREHPFTTTDLRNLNTIARNAKKAADISYASRLKEKSYSNVAIGEKMGINESSVRSLLAPGQQEKLDILHTTANMLKDNIDNNGGFLDVGTGVAAHIGVSNEKLGTALTILKDQGYEVIKVQVDQVGTQNKTTIPVLCPPGTKYKDVVTAKDQIRSITEVSDDGGRNFYGLQDPLSISSHRIGVTYAKDGGADADGVIYVRPGVEDVSIGSARYAQVRVSVDGTHYLKGMAVYKDDLPKGVDLMFNTNKDDSGNKLDAMKKVSEDPDNPFGAIVRQRVDPVSGKVTSAMNIVGSPNKEGSGEEGSWDGWSRNLPSQFLSKQSPSLAKTQLDMTYESKKNELDSILALTNPAVKQKLLQSFADSADSSAVHLKAAALPRQATKVLLPVNALKDNEVYVPTLRDGERVALVRFPHGGTFEIPELTVNNQHPKAKEILGERIEDAIGINSNVAKRLSGADFDGDTVLVIPNNSGVVKTQPALEGLKNFEPQAAYKPYDGMQTIDGGTYREATKSVDYGTNADGSPKLPSSRGKGMHMGLVSNLITDMTIKGASTTELAAAVRHSMVVIDAEKHKLNYKQSAIDNGIPHLMKKYQDRSQGGAKTLISQAGSKVDIRARKPLSADKGGPIDRATGKKLFKPTDEHYVDPRTGKTIYKTQKSKKLAEVENAHDLSSGTKIESIYADHSNRLKALANEARRVMVNTDTIPYSPSAKKVYDPEVKALVAKLNVAIKNRPLERQAQVLANATVATKRASNPAMSSDELKKIQAQALFEARTRTGAQRQVIDITPREWEAIQAGAITHNRLSQILDKADLNQVKQLATPRTQLLMTSTKTARAQQMASSGYTQAEIADALGVSLTTLKEGLKGG